MPKINRIRIVNFSYNHESRHILDECFDFHGGDDALLHLSNGGGKSVLVQLFLQPIVPGAKIQGRNISSFFRKQKLPAYIMIEWKLDGAGGGYLLTGIGFTAADAAEQEGKTRIRYFTFTSKYIGANAFDIAHIPLVEKHGDILEIKPFREARKIMADKARKEPYLLGYFAEDEGEQYAKHLAEFGISRDEWRNVIAKINDSENGLEDLFQKYRSSSQLLDDWIIKTVEKVMFKGRSEQRQLEEMLQSLVQEVIENERFIMEKQLFTGFLERFQDLQSGLTALLKNLEEQNNLGKNLAALHQYLGGEMIALREKQQANQDAIEVSIAEEKKVDLEERSHQYHKRKAEHQEAAEKLAAAEQASEYTENQLNEVKIQEKRIRAAGLAADIQHMSSDLSGIEEKLAMVKEDYNKDKRASLLEYTLKIRYEEQLKSLKAELADLQTEQQDRQERLKQENTLQRNLDADQRRHDSEIAKLQERLKTFTDQEKRMQQQLGQNWIRNLLGELDTPEMDRIKDRLQKNRDQIDTENEKLQLEKSSLLHKQQEIDQQWKEIHNSREAFTMALTNDQRELAEYQKREAEIKKIMAVYGFDFSLLFEPDRFALLFTKHSKEMQRNAEAATRTKNEAEESLLSIKNGYLHSSPELASALADLDIQYDTGESYLRNQAADIRQALLDRNPILPYTFIMSRPDMSRLAQSNLNIVLRRIIPLMAYEDLNLLVENQGGIARPREEIALTCMYEGRIFDQDSLQKLIMETEARQNEASALYERYSQAYQTTLVDFSACQRFNYATNFQYQLEKRINACEKSLLDLNNQLLALEEAKKQAIALQNDLDRQVQNALAKIPPAEAALQNFQEFLEKEQEYQHCRGRLDQVKHDLKSLEEQKELLMQSLNKLQTNIISGKNQITLREKQAEETIQKYQLYKEAAAGDMIEGSIEELEKRLTVIKADHNQEIAYLELRQHELTDQKRKVQKQLDKLGLEAEEYASVIFDETDLESAINEISRLEALLKRKQTENNDASRAEAAAAAALTVALDEVKRLGAEDPLSAQEIKGDFTGRRKQLQKQIDELETANISISRELSRCIKIMDNIEQTVDLAFIEPAKTFLPEADVVAQASRWEKDFRSLQNVNLDTASKLRSRYDNCKIDFKDKNLNLESIFKGLDPLWDKARMEYDDYYYLFERMSQHGEKLTELIVIYENQLANLERNKKDMVQQSFLQGRRLFEEIQLISEYSKVRLSGRSRPVQMLKIDLQLDNHESAQQRIKDYIEECILKVQEKTRQENRDDELRKAVARLMSSRELLNVYLGNAHIPVYVYKIDMNMQNSRTKSWEDAVRENSGAERFVVFFSMLSALMTYTRARNMESLGADPDSDTRVIIMDNPFGPISSEHLLEPMFEIAKKHRTQLICLTHLKDNSIMKCFNLIYMLKVRMGAIGGNEYLKVEEHIRDHSVLNSDEKLEKALYRASEFKEISLFEDD